MMVTMRFTLSSFIVSRSSSNVIVCVSTSNCPTMCPKVPDSASGRPGSTAAGATGAGDAATGEGAAGSGGKGGAEGVSGSAALGAGEGGCAAARVASFSSFSSPLVSAAGSTDIPAAAARAFADSPE